MRISDWSSDVCSSDLSLFPFGAVLLPTTLVVSVMMAPTWVATITDRSRDKHRGITVGMMNFAGTLPAIIDLWTRGQSHQTAMLLIGDVFVWALAYGAAFAGWGIFAVMPTLVGSFYRMTTDSRIKGLARQQRSEEHTSELQSLMRISYAVFCL